MREVSAHAQNDNRSAAAEIFAIGTYFPNSPRIVCIDNRFSIFETVGLETILSCRFSVVIILSASLSLGSFFSSASVTAGIRAQDQKDCNSWHLI
jgi:hypothetical protein